MKGFRGFQTLRPSPFISELNPKVYKKSSVYIGSTKKQSKKGAKGRQKSFFQTADELIKNGKK